MTTAYTSLLGLALPVTGELSGTWGDTVNTAITALLDSAVAGTTTISTDADITLSTTTGAANESREAIILWTAGGTVTRNITAPAQSKVYVVINKSSSTQSIVLRGVGPTTGVTIVLNEKAVCAWNGSDFVKVASTVITNLTGTLPVANGGTGQTTYTDGQLLIGNSTGNTLSKATLTAGSGISITNGAGSISIAASGGSGSTLTISNKTAAYTVVAGDNGTVINCTSGTFTVSLTAAATLASGFNVQIINTGTGTITIDPSGSETLDANTTWQLSKGQGVRILCDGTNFQTIAIRTSGQSANSVALGNNSGGTPSVAITGAGAMALGGSYASGTDSFAAANTDNTGTYGATGANSIAIGQTAKASTTACLALGYNALSSAGGAIAISARGSGTGATASGTASIAIGDYAAASGAQSVAIGAVQSIYGPSASAIGATAIGSGARAAQIGKYAYQGTDAFEGTVWVAGNQYGLLILAGLTTTATAKVLTSSGSGTAGSTNQLILSNNQAMAFTGTVVARQQAAGGTASAAWKVEGLIRREGTAASTTLVASTVTVISNVPAWAIALTADTTNGGLAVTATGAAATNIRWLSTIQTSEVIYA